MRRSTTRTGPDDDLQREGGRLGRSLSETVWCEARRWNGRNTREEMRGDATDRTAAAGMQVWFAVSQRGLPKPLAILASAG
jgi:hypothetical protein